MRLHSDLIRQPYFTYYINGVEIDDDVRAKTTSLTFTESDEKSDTAQIVIVDPTYKVFDSPDVVEGAQIEIVGGFVGYTRSLMNGYIAGMEPDFSNATAPRLTLNIMDETYPMSINKKNNRYEKFKRSQIVDRILKSYGIKGDIQDSGELVPSVLQSNQTDIAFIMQLASQLQWVAYMKRGVFYFKERNLDGAPKQQFHYNSNDSSLVSFQPQFIAVKDINNQVPTVITSDVTTAKKKTTATVKKKTTAKKKSTSTANKTAKKPKRT